LWVGITAAHLIGLGLFVGTVNTTEILEMWLLPQLRESSLREDMLLQDGAAPANFICSIVLFYFLRVDGWGDQFLQDFEYDRFHE
jgi:hypothetical protein